MLGLPYFSKTQSHKNCTPKRSIEQDFLNFARTSALDALQKIAAAAQSTETPQSTVTQNQESMGLQWLDILLLGPDYYETCRWLK